MIRQPIKLLGMLVALILFAGCGVTPSSTNTFPAPAANTSAPTSTGGAIDLATDHSVYTASSTVTITITNTTSSAIYASDTKASCSIVSLQIKQADGSWGGSSVAHCPLGRVALPVTIAPSGIYTAKIQAAVPNISHAVFATGTYRYVLIYASSAQALTDGSAPTALYSSTFQVA